MNLSMGKLITRPKVFEIIITEFFVINNLKNVIRARM